MATGFFTDTTVCIGCKACEVACKQWNDLPSDGGEFRKGGSYDNTGHLSGNTWRHVRFVELAENGEEPDLVALAGDGDRPVVWPVSGAGRSMNATCLHVESPS